MKAGNLPGSRRFPWGSPKVGTGPTFARLATSNFLPFQAGKPSNGAAALPYATPAAASTDRERSATLSGKIDSMQSGRGWMHWNPQCQQSMGSKIAL